MTPRTVIRGAEQQVFCDRLPFRLSFLNKCTRWSACWCRILQRVFGKDFPKALPPGNRALS